jgi:hypothetical protein
MLDMTPLFVFVHDDFDFVDDDLDPVHGRGPEPPDHSLSEL